MVAPATRWIAIALAAVALLACKKTEEQESIPFRLEPVAETALSARDLFEKARVSQKPEEKIGLYRRIVEEHPESDLADASQFMIGFVYAEELNDTAQAVRELRLLKEKWPESDWCDDAAAFIKDLQASPHE
jgi:hypothetical protein